MSELVSSSVWRLVLFGEAGGLLQHMRQLQQLRLAKGPADQLHPDGQATDHCAGVQAEGH